MSSGPRLILFAKYPLPGFAKTRLIPALGENGAAALHKTLTERSVKTLLASGSPVEVRYTGADAAAFSRWLGTNITLVEQVEGDLTDRLMAASYDTPHIFFGADTPDLTLQIVSQAIAALQQNEIVIGPARDGGFYLIGMRQARPELLTDMPWSTDQVLPETLRRLEALGIAPVMLPILSDCDRPEDLAQWPELAVKA
jgi:rSAM/selenodomain-associated transferase 1